MLILDDGIPLTQRERYENAKKDLKRLEKKGLAADHELELIVKAGDLIIDEEKKKAGENKEKRDEEYLDNVETELFKNKEFRLQRKAEKASIIGDTVGDPLKDTSGPSLNILVKLSSIISVVFGPLFIKTAYLMHH